jgi:hypothetical protein
MALSAVCFWVTVLICVYQLRHIPNDSFATRKPVIFAYTTCECRKQVDDDLRIAEKELPFEVIWNLREPPKHLDSYGDPLFWLNPASDFPPVVFDDSDWSVSNLCEAWATAMTKK